MIRLCVSAGTSGRRHILFVIAVYLYSLFVVYLGLKAANKRDRLSKLGETHPRFARQTLQPRLNSLLLPLLIQNVQQTSCSLITISLFTLCKPDEKGNQLKHCSVINTTQLYKERVLGVRITKSTYKLGI